MKSLGVVATGSHMIWVGGRSEVFWARLPATTRLDLGGRGAGSIAGTKTGPMANQFPRKQEMNVISWRCKDRFVDGEGWKDGIASVCRAGKEHKLCSPAK